MAEDKMFVPSDLDWYDRKLDCFLAVAGCVEAEFGRLVEDASTLDRVGGACVESTSPTKGCTFVSELLPTAGGHVSRSELEKEMPYYARSGLYLAMFGFAEDALRSIAETFPEPSDKKVRSFKGYGMAPLCDYLKKVREIEVAEGMLCGNVKTLTSKTRHILIHCGGQIEEGSDDLRKFPDWTRNCSAQSLIGLDSENRIRMEARFLDWFMIEAKKTIAGVLRELVPTTE